MGDVRTTTGQKPPETAQQRRSRLKSALRVAALLVLVVGLIGHVIKMPKYAYARGYVTTMEYAEVRSAAEGRLAEILKTSGDEVQAGDVLLRLEDDTERAAFEEANSKVAQGEAELTYREAEAADALRRHTNAIIAAEIELEQMRKTLELTRQLHEKALASGRQLSNDEFAVRRAEDRLRALHEVDMSVPLKQVAALSQNVAALREVANRAKAALDARTVRAPISGRVVRYTFYVGEMIRPDLVLYEVFGGEVCTMKLRIPERYAARVRLGHRVEAKLGTHRRLVSRRFPGKIAVLRDVVENDGTDSYRVAYADIDLQGEQVPPGTSVDARIRIGRTSVWMHILEP
ncbi:MAG: HlyD family secretion protein [Kiritimatiellia bacterium]|jgi:multidrug resistance efflux pump